jgi:hypothetical protein
MGSLTSELVVIHENKYVVRALIHIGGTLFATGLATATDIEQAEDRAKIRALEALGIQPSPKPSSISASPFSPTSGAEKTDSTSQYQEIQRPFLGGVPIAPQPAIASSPEATHSLPLSEPPLWPDSEMVSPPFTIESLPEQPETVVADLYSHITLDPNPTISMAGSMTGSVTDDFSSIHDSAFESKPEDLSAPNQPSELPSADPVKTNPSRRKGSPSAKSAVSMPPSIDLSDVIAQIGAEMLRLGWTTTQGREHLRQTYGKRSRQELNEQELYDFLDYLKSQP